MLEMSLLAYLEGIDLSWLCSGQIQAMLAWLDHCEEEFVHES
jgi:hypothetical protein